MGDRERETLTARNAPVMDDFIPDGNFDMRRGWEAAIKACLDQLCAATPSPGAGRELDARTIHEATDNAGLACDGNHGKGWGACQIIADRLPEAALGAGSTRGEPDPIGPHTRFDHDGTWRHHHHDQTGDPVWWDRVEQFGGEKVEHRHATRGEPDQELRAAAERVIRATEGVRDAINGIGHPGTPHDRVVHMDPCMSDPEVHVYSTSTDCAACGGSEYGAEDELNGAIGDLRAACGYERRPWEYERSAPVALADQP